MFHLEKLYLIIKREYLVRIRSNVFLITTLLAPVMMILLLVLPLIIQSLTADRSRQFYVYDETGMIADRLAETDSQFYKRVVTDPDTLREQLIQGKIEGYILLPHEILDGEGRAGFYHDGSAGMSVSNRIHSDIRSAVRDIRLDRIDTPDEVRSVIAYHLTIENRTISETGEEAADNGLHAIIGFMMGFIIYGAMIGYGAVIMRSVLEEKSSRIIEVIASSVQPFELLLGKVIGNVSISHIG
ncbi:MAG: ABC transporter permease [Balneolales bacterium]